MLKFALLGYLSLSTFTGYELKQLMDASGTNIWHAKQSQIYTTLKKMEEGGLLTSEIVPQNERPDRKVYKISDTGLHELKDWLRKPITNLIPIKDGSLLKFFFSMHLQEKDYLVTQLRLSKNQRSHQLDFHESGCENLKELVTSNKDLDSLTKMKTSLLLDSLGDLGKMLCTAYIKWIEKTIDKIENNFEKEIENEVEDIPYLPSIE